MTPNAFHPSSLCRCDDCNPPVKTVLVETPATQRLLMDMLESANAEVRRLTGELAVLKRELEESRAKKPKRKRRTK